MRRTFTLGTAIVFASAALLYSAACGSSSTGVTGPTPPPSGGGANVTIAIVGSSGSQSYSPNPASVAVGQTAAWKNNDPNTHHIVADNGSFDTGLVAPGATTPAVTVGNGAISYHCTIHPSMVGSINGSVSGGPTGPGY